MESTKAVTFDTYGGPLSVGTLKLRALKPKQILVKVFSVSLNPIDYKRKDGMTKLIIKDEFPAGVCFDVAGTVESVGAEVTTFKVGDRLCARSLKSGTLAEYCIVDESVSAKIPDNVSYNDAAALPLAGMTAYQSLLRGGLKEGDSVFIAGGSGGVGMFAVQLAKKVFKAGRVVSTCSGPKVDFVRSLGADEVLDYTKCNPYKDAKGPFDLVFDTVGDAAKMGGHLIKPGNFVISVAALPESGAFDRIGRPIPFFLRVALSVVYLRYKFAVSPGVYNYVFLNPNSEDLTKLINLVSDGTLKVELDSTYNGLEQGAEAFKRLETGRAKGKVVVVVNSA